MAELRDIIELANDMTLARVSTDYADAQANSDELVKMITERIGERTIGFNDLYPGSDLYTIITVVTPTIVHEGLTGNEFFMDMVEYHNVALGDDIEFETEDKTYLIAAKATYGTDGIRRQRLLGSKKYTLDTDLYVVKVYEEWKNLVAHRIRWDKLVAKVSDAMTRVVLDKVATVFNGLSATDLGATYYPVKGNYDETKLLVLINHVKAANPGMQVRLVGTELALSQVTTAVLSESAKESDYATGIYGKFHGTPMVRVAQRHAQGTDNFLLPNDRVFVMVSGSKPIKVLNRGEGFAYIKHPFDQADHTVNYFYAQDFGVGLHISDKGLGVYEFTSTL